jgi:3-hydroxyisobutyrate dehydrogenase-like beta-hydroxyacid dehydrogenase
MKEGTMTQTTIGVLHPGEMGSEVAACARAAGLRVLWVSTGRGGATQKRAAAAGLEDAGRLRDLVASSDVILSVCPPHAALDVARDVTAAGFTRLYVDGNAVSPATARRIAAVIEGGGATFIDGGIIGPPPRTRGTTRLYVSGAGAPQVKALFGDSALEVIALDAPAGAASAVKMAYASWTKGTSALILSVRALAASEGVDDALLGEWRVSQPQLPKRSEDAVSGNARKAWRFVGEMEEIAATFAEAGLPDGFHLAAAEVFRRLSRYKDAPTPSMADVAHALTEPPPHG